MNRSGRTTRHAAQKATARADALGDAPRLTELLAQGKVSSDHADALAYEIGKLDEEQRATLLDSEAELASHAAGSTPEQFRRHLKRTIQQQSNDDGIDESERQREQARVALGKNEHTGMGEIRGEPATVAVHISLPSLLDEPGVDKFGEYSDGTPVPAETVRRHACDANIIPVVLNGEAQPLDVGRAQRLATPEQRTALRAMYRTCAIDGCNTNFDRCELHHLLEWTAHQGPTDLKFLLPLCGSHHHRAHEGRWQLQRDPDARELTVTYPDGTNHSTALPDILNEQRTGPLAAPPKPEQRPSRPATEAA